MNNLSSNRLSTEDLSYFQSNFRVLDSSVESIDDAEYILLGEVHNRKEHKINEMWLINKLAVDNDTLFLENDRELKNFTKLSIGADYGYNTIANLKYKCWDHVEARSKLTRELKISKMQLASITSYANSSTINPHLIRKRIADCLKWCDLEESIKLYDLYKKETDASKLTPYPETTKLLYELQNQTKILKIFSEEAKNASEEDLKGIYLSILGLSASIISDIFLFISFIMDIPRNFSLANKLITESSPDQSEKSRKWLIAGKAHVRCYGSSETKEVIEPLKSRLQGKKYTILLPRKQDTSYAETYLDNYRHTKLNNLKIYAHSFFKLSAPILLILSMKPVVKFVFNAAIPPEYTASALLATYFKYLYEGFKSIGVDYRDINVLFKDTIQLHEKLNNMLLTEPTSLIDRLEKIYSDNMPFEDAEKVSH